MGGNFVKKIFLSFQISGMSFGSAMIWQYESMRSEALKTLNNVRSRFGKHGDLRQTVSVFETQISHH
jgi:hypothetical protein